MYNKLGLQLYTVRDHMTNADDIRATFKKLKALGYTQGQTAGCAIPYADYGRIAKEEDFEIVGTHEEFCHLVDDTDGAIEEHKLLGTNMMGIGGVDLAYFNTVESTNEFLTKLNTVCEKIKAHGLKFSYHNHSAEYKKVGGETIMDILLKNTDPEVFTFCLDTYWVQYGGGNVLETIEKLAGRIDLLHLKDMKITRWNPEICEIGNGTLRWPEILKLAEDTGVKTIIVEQDGYWMNEDPFQSIKVSADYLAPFLGR